MADWFYYPRCRYDSQGVPQSPFQGGTPVAAGDRGFAWGSQSILAVPTATPNLTIAYGGVTNGYVLDDTDGLLFDDVGGVFPNTAWPGGTISMVSVTIPASFSAGTWGYDYYLRRRADGSTVFLQSNVGFGPPVNGVSWPDYTTNPFTGLAWSASDLMGSAAAYDFYYTVNADVSYGGAGVDFVRFSALLVTFTPIPPSVIRVNPPTGSVNGGQAVTITGTGFTAATGAEFGGVAATSVVVVSDTRITAVTPEHAVGTVDVEVLSVATGTNLYTYFIPPSFRLDPLPRDPIVQGRGQRGR